MTRVDFYIEMLIFALVTFCVGEGWVSQYADAPVAHMGALMAGWAVGGLVFTPLRLWLEGRA